MLAKKIDFYLIVGNTMLGKGTSDYHQEMNSVYFERWQKQFPTAFTRQTSHSYR